MNVHDPRTVARLAKMRAALTGKVLTRHQVAEACAMSNSWVLKYIRYLMAQGEVYIAAWPPYGKCSHRIPAYTRGQGTNVPKPDTSQIVRNRNYLARIKADKKRHAAYLESCKAYRRRKKFVATRMDLVAALFGPPTTNRKENNDGNQ